MDAHAAQENGLTVQQNIAASGLNGAKADLVLHAIGFGFDQYIVELGIVRRPQRQVCVESNLRRSGCIRSEGLADPGFRNSHGYFLIGLISIKFHPAADPFS